MPEPRRDGLQGWLAPGSRMIDILVPVLGRPQNAQPLVDSIVKATEVEFRITFLLSPDDDEEMAAVFKTECPYIRSPDGRYAPKINLGVRLTQGEFVFLGADDLRFWPGWDTAAIERWEETGKPVIGTNDLGNATVMAGRHATHSLVHRSYVERGTIDDPDCLLHEGYQHNWVDTEFIGTAMKRDAFTFCRESHVEHLHPFWHKGSDDEVYDKGRQTYAIDRRLYLKRRRFWR
jgi:Glycosyl transferase family 2